MKIGYAIRGVNQGAARGQSSAAKAMRVDTSKAVRKALALIEKAHKGNIRRGGGKGKPVRQVWTWRTGELARSFRIDYKRGNLFGYYGSTAKYSHVIEMGTREAIGGPIRPRRGKHLAIPVGKARYGVGGGLWPKDYAKGDLFRLTSRRGNKLLMSRKTGEPMFVLKRRVKIDGRGMLDRTVHLNRLKVARLIADASAGAALDSIGVSTGGGGGDA